MQSVLPAPTQAFNQFLDAIDAAGVAMPPEIIPALTARDRVLAQDIISPIPLPEFRRSTVDGFAVQAASVQAALATGGTLRVIGEVRMGEMSRYMVGEGEAVKIHTGGNVPVGADAILMVENAQLQAAAAENRAENEAKFDDNNGLKMLDEPNNSALRPMSALSPNDNIIDLGEDVHAGEIVIRKGSRLKEADLGGLASFGILKIKAARQPRVALIASGDEVVPAETEVLQPGQVRSVNIHTVAALVRRNGGIPLDYGILPDRFEAFQAAAARAMREADVVVFMAGTSMSDRDFVPEVVKTMGQPGILQHGIAFRPGKPTLFALCDGKPVFGLPGNPISTLVTATLFLAPTLWYLQRTHTCLLYTS
nr:molybdopterin molybdotransferase MoeA [Anaerolineae bacterium]